MISQGVTLVEMLIVVAVLGILFSIGLISYLPFRDSKLVDDAAFSVAQAFTTATARARRTSGTVSVKLNPSAKTVKVENSGGTVLFEKSLPVSDVSLSCRDVTCVAGENTITLLAPGATLPFDLSVTVTRGSRSQTVKILGPSAVVAYR